MLRLSTRLVMPALLTVAALNGAFQGAAVRITSPNIEDGRDTCIARSLDYCLTI